MNFSVAPFDRDQTQDVVSFSKLHPWKPVWSEELVHRFLTQLTSSPALVFDIRDGSERVAAGVLLDKVQNPGNFANLEILGMSPDREPVPVIDQIISLAKERIPKSQSGFQIGFHHSHDWVSSLVSQHQLSPYYETFEMLNDNPSASMDSAQSFHIANPDDDSELYRILVDSFQENVDTSIPAFGDWKASRSTSSNSRTWLAKKDGRITGFLTLVAAPSDKKAEIRTVGVLPRMRGKGIGKALIQSALHHLKTLAIPACELTVAVQNKNALNLYRQLGFKEVDHYFVYKWIKQ